MKRMIWGLSVLICVFISKNLFALDPAAVLPEDSKLVVVLKDFTWVEKMATSMEDDQEDKEKVDTILSQINKDETAVMAYFGKSPDLKEMGNSFESNLVIVFKLSVSPDEFYKTIEGLTESQMKKEKNGVVSFDKVYLLPLADNQMALAPVADVLNRYKKAKMIATSKSSDAQSIQAFLKDYQSKPVSAIMVPSVYDKFIKDNKLEFPKELGKFDMLKDIKDLILYVEDNSMVISLRMKNSSTALKNIFASQNKNITVEQFAKTDPTAYLELAFSRDFLSTVLNYVMSSKGSEMPEGTIDNVLGNMTGNFGITLYPAPGKTEKELMSGVPDMLVFIGAPSDTSATMLLGVIGGFSPLTTIKIADKEVFVMETGQDEMKFYLTVDKSHVVGCNNKTILTDYLKNSKSGKETFINEMVTKISDTEVMGLSMYLKVKSILEAVGDELPFGEVTEKSTVEKGLLYIGPSTNYDAFNIKILYK